jgi:hypothetical protein
MTKYIASVSHWTQQQRDSQPSVFVARLIAAPLLLIGGALLVSAAFNHEFSQAAIGLLSVVAAGVLNSATR